MVLLADSNLPQRILSEERTSGTIEAWNYILKAVEYPEHRKRPDVFLKKQCHQVVLGRQLQFVDQLRKGRG